MAMRDINTIEWQLILCLRDAVGSPDKNASRSGILDQGTQDERHIKIRWYKDKSTINRKRFLGVVLVNEGPDL